MKNKICSRCQITKEISEFYSDKRASDGLSCHCKKCQNKATIESRNKNRKKWDLYSKKYAFEHKKDKAEYYKKHKNNYINNRLKNKFGITLNDYNQMLITQNGVCAICGKPETSLDNYSYNIKALTVDHNHKTGKVRGLLCMNCNRCLGLLKDNVNTLNNAIKYLQKEK